MRKLSISILIAMYATGCGSATPVDTAPPAAPATTTTAPVSQAPAVPSAPAAPPVLELTDELELRLVGLASLEPQQLLERWQIDARQREAEMATYLGDNHPEMQGVRAEIAALGWAASQWDAIGGGDLALRYASLCRRAADAALRLGDKHPEVVGLDAEIGVVVDEIVARSPGATPRCTAP